MITPNIEELIAVLNATNQFHDNADICTADVIAALQSQAARIKELEAEIITRTSYGDEQTDFAIKLAGERDALRAQLAELEMEEPDIYVHQDGLQVWEAKNNAALENDPNFTAYFTRPMPAQPIIGLQDVHDAVTADPTLADCSQDVNAELVEALEKLARLGNGDQYGNSDGNMIARNALSKYKGAK